MPNLACPDCGKEKYVDRLTIRVKDGVAFSPESECDCGGVMVNTTPKDGVPSLGRMNKNGSSY